MPKEDHKVSDRDVAKTRPSFFLLLTKTDKELTRRPRDLLVLDRLVMSIVDERRLENSYWRC